MRQFVVTNNYEEDGVPMGGTVRGCGIVIDWQKGGLVNPDTGDRIEPNGAFVEDVIEACLTRLRFYQTGCGGKFACRQNALAITKLEEALHWLDDRTREREARGVEGTYTP